jgi:hypothetical protein
MGEIGPYVVVFDPNNEANLDINDILTQPFPTKDNNFNLFEFPL